MPGKERYLPAPVVEALNRLRSEITPWWRVASRPIAVTFPVADAQIDVRHGLSVTPDFFLVSADAVITREPGAIWTPQLAYLRADTAGAHATIVFFVLGG